MSMRLTTVLCSISLMAPAAEGADWPQWGGSSERNMVSLERSLPEWFAPGSKNPRGKGIDLGTTQNVAWTARLGTQCHSSPVIAGGRVYIGCNDAWLEDGRYRSSGGGLLLCLDEKTGKVLWRLPIPKLAWFERWDKYSGFKWPIGICSTPTVDGDRLYVISNRGEVLCLDVRGQANGNDGPFRDEGPYTAGPDKSAVEIQSGDADIVWRFDMASQLEIFPHDALCCGIVVCGDVLYAATGNGVADQETPRPLAPSLIALDKRTGRLVGYDEAKIGTGVWHGQWSSPSLSRVKGRNLVFYGGGDGRCYAFEALAAVPAEPQPLQTIWQYDCNPPHYRFRDGKPIDYWDGAVDYGDANDNDGQYVGPSEIIGTPVCYKERVYVTIGQDPTHGRGRGALHCIDATQTGDISTSGRIWCCEQIERSLATVSIADGLLYVADLSGCIRCLDAATGYCHWLHKTKAETWASTLVADGKVFLPTRKHLWVLAAGKVKRVLAKIPMGSPVWCNVAAANGALYVASQKHLWAVRQLGAKTPPLLTGTTSAHGSTVE